jgi:DMSO/TMAO reductase YedYZ molybdopterin-dependent catalytic subunit
MKPTRRELIVRIIKSAFLTPLFSVFGVTPVGARVFPTRTVEKDTFAFNPATGAVQWKNKGESEPFEFVIDGLVEAPAKLSYSDLRSLPQTSQVNDFHCVEGWTIRSVQWSGIAFKELIKLVKPQKGADCVLFHSLGETTSKPRGQAWYVEGFRVADLLDPAQEMLLALDLDGKPLPDDRGAPLRVVTPYLLAYKSIKFVRRMEFTSRLKEGWWTLANPIYDVEARVPRGRLRPAGAGVDNTRGK